MNAIVEMSNTRIINDADGVVGDPSLQAVEAGQVMVLLALSGINYFKVNQSLVSSVYCTSRQWRIYTKSRWWGYNSGMSQLAACPMNLTKTNEGDVAGGELM